MNTLNLKTLYRDATRALPRDADLRVTTDELLALARGDSLGARQDATVAGLATSSEQAVAARIAMATQAWSQDLADDLAALRRPRMGERIRIWFKAATLPPVFAACAISLLAVAAWRVSEPALAPTMAPMPQLAADDLLFGGDFDESVARNNDNDELFGGGFDS
ncbi:MAG TPA: hypothetical protein VN581_06555 [Patescibacteria group bacterium]|nr:hypothetical protein [Patescibacteria group bacterium]